MKLASENIRRLRIVATRIMSHDASTDPNIRDSTETEQGSDVEFIDKDKRRVNSTYYHRSPQVGDNAAGLTHPRSEGQDVTCRMLSLPP